jgi:hypothetical protein
MLVPSILICSLSRTKQGYTLQVFSVRRYAIFLFSHFGGRPTRYILECDDRKGPPLQESPCYESGNEKAVLGSHIALSQKIKPGYLKMAVTPRRLHIRLPRIFPDTGR